MPADSPIWDIWDAIKSAWPGPTANWPAEPQPAWLFAIDGLRAEQVQQGVRAMVQQGGEFPPSAPVFRSLCLAPPDWAHRRTAMTADALPPPRPDFLPPEAAKRELAKIKAMISEGAA